MGHVEKDVVSHDALIFFYLSVWDVALEHRPMAKNELSKLTWNPGSKHK